MMRDMPDKNTRQKNDFQGFDDAIEVFRAGEHTSSNGVKRSWSHSDLDEMVANHSAETAAPIVIGHPKDADPAFGWVDTLTRDGDSLMARFRDVNPDFSSSVEKGEFRKRSVRIYKTPDNTLAVEHVGFLGGKRPAIALDAMNYNASDAGEVYDFEVDAYTPSVVSRLFRGIRDYFIEKEGVETADRLIPDYLTESLSEHATSLRESTAQDSPAFSAPDKGDTPNDNTEGDDEVSTFTQADIDAAKQAGKDEAQADFSASETTAQQQLKVEQDKNRKAEFTAFVGGLECDPAKKEGMVDFMMQLSGDDDAQFEFSAGDGDNKQTVKKSPLDYFKDFASSLKSSVDFNESDAGDGETVDLGDSQAIANAAVEFQASEAEAGRTVSVSQAVQHVTKGADK